MRSFKIFALFATLLATSRAIPIQREDFDLVARDVDELSLEARDFNDAQVSFHARDLGSEDDELFAREEFELLDARELYSDDLLEARSDEDLFAEIFARNRGNAAIKAQGQRQEAKVKKANANKKTSDRAASASNALIPKPKLAATPGQTPEQKKDARTKYDAETASRAKAANKAGAQAVTQAVKDKKTARTEKWANAKGVPGVKTGAKPNNPAGSRATRLATKQANRATTKTEMRAAGQRMQNTVNIPNRNDKFTVSTAKNPTDPSTKVITGKDARKAVYAANVNEPRPAGPQRMPKTFNNDPYAPTHPNPALRNQPTIPGLPAGQGREYPVLSGSKSGWTGDSPVGTARVITQNGAGGAPDTFHGVVAHDKTKGGSNHDHYLAPKSREFVEDFEDEWM